MAKKCSFIAAMTALLACVVPTVAGATKLTDPADVLIAASPTKPVTIVGTSTNVEITHSLVGTISCTTVKATGTLTENTGTKVVASEDTGSGPFACGSVPAITMTNLKLLKIESSSTTSTLLSLSFELVFRGGAACKFTGTNVPVTFVAGASSFHFAGPLNTTAACKDGTPEIHGDLFLETTNGILVVIDD